MPTPPKTDPQPAKERAAVREKLNGHIGDQVIHSLGKPNGLHEVQVRWLWDNHYRVNVLVGGDVVSLKVANSYFLVADGEGNIIKSTPTITKQN